MDDDATAFKKQKFSFKKKNVVEIEIIDFHNDPESDYSGHGSVGDQLSQSAFASSGSSSFEQSEADKTIALDSSSDDNSPGKEKENKLQRINSFQNQKSPSKDAWAGLMGRMQGSQNCQKSPSKDAWKGLMGRMQGNQKEALKNIKNKPQKRGLTAVFEAAKNKQKKFKLDTDTESSNSTNKIMDNLTATSSPQKESKVADIFLKPKDKLAVAAESKMKTLDLCTGGDFLKAVSRPAFETSQEVIVDDPKYFDENIIKVNEIISDDTGPAKTKQCPFYKKLPGTTFSVDAFNFGVIPGINIYFLSHFHSDHYIGLTKKFSKTLVCSIPTANLVKMKIGVSEHCIRQLQLNKPYIIEGSEVVLVDANHCPGSVMFIFRLPNGTTYFHTGDFRYTTDMLENTYIVGSIGTDCLYLDTTYCDPKYDFPTQVDSISQLVTTVKKHIQLQPKTLIICGSYLIGKERVYFTLAEALGAKVYGTVDKRRIINALENPLYKYYLTDQENLACIHVVNMQCINPKFLSEYLSTRSTLYTNIIGIKPSGWQFSSGGTGGSVKNYYGKTVTIIGVPYSEHSSFSELRELVTAIKPRKVQPTVNVGNEKKRNEMMAHIGKWLKK